jgi:hypothetical protein
MYSATIFVFCGHHLDMQDKRKAVGRDRKHLLFFYDFLGGISDLFVIGGFSETDLDFIIKFLRNTPPVDLLSGCRQSILRCPLLRCQNNTFK